MNDGARQLSKCIMWRFRPLEGKIKIWQTAANTGVLSEVYINIIIIIISSSIQNVAQEHFGSVRQINLDSRSGQNLDCICSNRPSPAHRVFCLHQRPNSIWLLVWDPV